MRTGLSYRAAECAVAAYFRLIFGGFSYTFH